MALEELTLFYSDCTLDLVVLLSLVNYVLALIDT